MTSGASATNPLHFYEWRGSPAVQRVSIRTFRPTSQPSLQPLQERRQLGLPIGSSACVSHQHADEPHRSPCALGKRDHSRAAENREKSRRLMSAPQAQETASCASNEYFDRG